MPDRLARLFDLTGATDHLVVRIVCAAAVLGIVGGLIAGFVLAGRSPALAKDIRVRSLTWIGLVLVTLVPMLAGRLWAILLVAGLCLLSYREFARATGLFRARLISALVVLGILAVTFANIDNWPGFRTALVAFVPLLIVVLSVLQDQPKGYIQRCALGCSAFLLFGMALGRLGSLTVDDQYRALLCTIIFSCQLSDVAGYTFGKLLGGKHLLPNTSPNKTLGGHAGALLTITPLSAYLYHLTFAGTPIDTWPHLLTLGLLTALLAQVGDLVISSIKRDVGIKDMGATLPGHGGVLDRCNSLLLVAPVVYHYVLFFNNLGAGVPQRIITGSAGVP